MWGRAPGVSELAKEWTKSLAVPPDDQAAIDGLAAASGACSSDCAPEGVDLEGYNWREVAADVRDLALAEDLGSVTVAAGSYLTLPAVSFARSNPDMANAAADQSDTSRSVSGGRGRVRHRSQSRT